jgi:predicted metal-dependent hydrolase
MDNDFNYQVIKSKKRRKTISLHIKADGKITVYAPYDTPKSQIERFVQEKKSWITDKIAEKEKSIREAEKVFLSGERFLYLGESYSLEIRDMKIKKHPLTLSFGQFILDQDYIEDAKRLFTQWYQKEAREKILKRIDYYSNKIQLFPKGVRITSAKYRWGSCSGDNRLSFSWRIMMASLDIIDYILIHELVHIKEKNHSRRFWGYLESILPGYRKQRFWLKKNGHFLALF